MIAASTELRKALMKGTALRAGSVLRAEWNHNRYAGILKVGNINDVEDYDDEMFPIKSIVEPERPRSGLAKARTRPRGQPAEGSTAQDYGRHP